MLYTAPGVELISQEGKILKKFDSLILMSLYAKLGLTLVVCFASYYTLLKTQDRMGIVMDLTRLSQEENAGSFTWNKYSYCIAVITFIFILFLTLMLYTAWPRGDEWMLIKCREEGLLKGINTAKYYYSNWCSRAPEFIGVAFGLSRNMWQNRLITPFFVSAIPFLAFTLCAPRGLKLSSIEGLLFIASAYALILLIAPYFYSCYWVNVTYVWTAAFALLFLYLFRRKYGRHTSTLIVAFISALIAGWSTECGSLAFGALVLLFSYEHYRKKSWTRLQTIALIGFIAGCFMLFTSPAMHRRATCDHTILENMTQEQIYDYVRNLSWEKVKALKGGAVIAVLKDVPYHLRIYFWPYLMELYLGIAGPALIACGSVFCMAAMHFRQNRKAMIYCLIGLGISVSCASFYLAGAIPNRGSIYPAAFIAFIAFCYLLANTKLHTIIRIGITLLLCAIAITQYVPGTIYAARLVPLRTQRDVELDRQARLHQEEIILPPIPELEHNRKGIAETLTQKGNISDDSSSWTNTNVAKWIKVHYGYMPKSVIQQKSDK